MSRRAHQSGTHWPCLVVARPEAPPLGYSMGNRERVREMHAILSSRGAKIGDPGSRHPPPTLPCNPVHPCYILHARRRRADPRRR
jgi:hypothetical protein